jgi:hypothetical protein
VLLAPLHHRLFWLGGFRLFMPVGNLLVFMGRLIGFLDLAGEPGEDLPAHLELLFHHGRQFRKHPVLGGDQLLEFRAGRGTGFRCRQGVLLFLHKFAAAFPDLADTVDPFLPRGERFPELLVKFMAVGTLEDQRDLRVIDLLVFPFLDPCHRYSLTMSAGLNKDPYSTLDFFFQDIPSGTIVTT